MHLKSWHSILGFVSAPKAETNRKKAIFTPFYENPEDCNFGDGLNELVISI